MSPSIEVEPFFHLQVDPGAPVRLRVGLGRRPPRDYLLPELEQGAFLDLFENLAADFGLRRPLAREAPPAAEGPPLTAILTHPVSSRILYGYGDPCVVRVGEADYRLLVTSNDAPDAFPILASSDLRDWRLSGFVFPEGSAPAWALTGKGVADFWAPELHRLGEAWVVCFTARLPDRSLAIGLARASSPDGPFEADPAPLLSGGVIDPHMLVDATGAPWLIWKRDDNGVWPRLLAELLHRQPDLVPRMFDAPADIRTARFTLALWPWIAGQEPMVQFFALQLLIEAAAEDLPSFERRLIEVRTELELDDARLVTEALLALRTRVYAQRLSADASTLEGERHVILQNDQPWEAHLIEGVWIARQDGHYFLLYAGNDFSTSRYGVGTAVATAPQGPYRKGAEVFLSSTKEWWGPGHPSVAVAPDGRPHIFLHGFRPGEAGYKAFRALLSAPLSLAGGRISLD
jgi:hypothetical protein